MAAQKKKPWYLETTGTTPELCRVCAQVNFAWLLEHDFSKARWDHWKSAPSDDDGLQHTNFPETNTKTTYNFPELSLGFLCEIIEKSESCTFCNLTSQTVAALYKIEKQELLKYEFGDFPSRSVFCTLENTKKHLTPNDTYDLIINLTNIQSNFHVFQQATIHRIEDNNAVPYTGRLVSRQINFLSIKNWLARFHPSDESFENQEKIIPGFRVVDVLNNNIIPVRGPRGCRYLALSYVWGGPQEFQNVRAIDTKLQLPGSLLKHPLPKTIEDAILLTSNVGERFLWVDSLCIVQDDGEAKMVQINAMDQVYSCAIAAIVAIDGRSCHDGLPGVRSTEGRWKQHTISVRGIRLANKQINGRAGRECVWTTRGWTYQEHALSQRCIHFDSDGLQFESEDGLFVEDVYPPPHNLQPQQAPCGIPAAVTVPGIHLQSNIVLYALSVSFYSTRSLTYESDALSAFQGVLNVHRNRFRRNFLYGMPSSELEFSLIWQPVGHIYRRIHDDNNRAMFPSWSWIGWKGTVVLPLSNAARFSRVTWINAGDMVTEFTSEDWRGTESTELGNWKLVTNHGADVIPCFYQENEPTARFAHPISQQIPHRFEGYLFLRENSHVLSFCALTVSLEAEPGNRSLEDPEDTNATSPDTVHSYTLKDRFDRCCGIVYLHSQDTKTNRSRKLQCVAISRTKYGTGNASSDAPPSDDSDVTQIRAEYALRQHLRSKSEQRNASNYFDTYDFELKWQAYDIVVIARLAKSEGLSERIGVGFCLVEAFWDADPERMVVSLA
ncbi:HET-domain-containing protein [Corynespora cassiicola Philippines]|uniref:HET-domain-containing protein n=1 Tax=Corynespora cassiicola Philippines TaxID=1448308 RepID=A0A2T2P9B7_CORCC|nr:HET-domain-containing protein [Corynespora cassiicola Philippines]